jgi:hypothetical protein
MPCIARKGMLIRNPPSLRSDGPTYFLKIRSKQQMDVTVNEETKFLPE